MAKYKILSLDGGGSWAITQVMALQNIYGGDAKAEEVLSDFDLIVANSGGSIVAMGLYLHMPLNKIANLFDDENNRKKTFKKVSWFKNILRKVKLPIPKYLTKQKLLSLEEFYNSNKNENTSKKNFLITSFDYDKERVKFFRTNKKSKAGNFHKTEEMEDDFDFYEAVHASSTAPVLFFDTPATLQSFPERRFWDGGVAGYNNPVLAGIVEALANGIKLNDINVLSIGTGATLLPLSGETTNPILLKQKEDTGIVPDIEKLARSILSEPPDSASFMAHIFLNGKIPNNEEDKISDGNLVRMNPVIQPIKLNKKWNFPNGLNENEFKQLLNLSLDAVEKEDYLLVVKLADLWLNDKITNQSIRVNSDFENEIGHGTFSEAKRHWGTL